MSSQQHPRPKADMPQGQAAPSIGTGIGFQRIRRITGYLVGDLSRWGDAKRKEESERVKHGFEQRAVSK